MFHLNYGLEFFRESFHRYIFVDIAFFAKQICCFFDHFLHDVDGKLHSAIAHLLLTIPYFRCTCGRNNERKISDTRTNLATQAVVNPSQEQIRQSNLATQAVVNWKISGVDGV